jgi:hypothetical protein
MVSFTPSTDRWRHRLVDETIESAAEAVSDPHVIKKIGETARGILSVLGRYFVPNVRHGEVLAPPSLDTSDLLPIVALRNARERLRVRDPKLLSMTDTQISNTIDMLGCNGSVSDAMEKFLHTLRVQSIDLFQIKETVCAFVITGHKSTFVSNPNASTLEGLGLSSELGEASITANSRPITGLLRLMREPTGDVVALSLAHETIHCIQDERKPIFAELAENDRLRQSVETEFEAYNIEWAIAKALYHGSSNPKFKGDKRLLAGAAMAKDVDTFRKRLERKSSNKDVAEVIAYLNKHGCPIVVS